MSKNNPNLEAIISKLLTMVEPSEEEIHHRELMRKNGQIIEMQCK